MPLTERKGDVQFVLHKNCNIPASAVSLAIATKPKGKYIFSESPPIPFLLEW
jgi:hypothetical protein